MACIALTSNLTISGNCKFSLYLSPSVHGAGRGGAGRVFTRQAPPLHGAGWNISSVIPAPSPGPAPVTPCTGLRFSPPILDECLSRGWVGWGMEEKTPRRTPVIGAGRGIGPAARHFRGPGGPVTNSNFLLRLAKKALLIRPSIKLQRWRYDCTTSDGR